MIGPVQITTDRSTTTIDQRTPKVGTLLTPQREDHPYCHLTMRYHMVGE
jgi:hypothetical protein